MRALEEEKLPSKLNLRIWLRMGRYILDSLPVLITIVVAMLFTAFYDSSFVPVMNAALTGGVPALSASKDFFATELSIVFVSGLIEIKTSMGVFLILEIVAILLRSASIFLTFYLTSYLGMKIMVGLRKDSFAHVQELSFSYFDKNNSGWLIARMNNDTSAIGDVLSNDIVNIFWALFDIAFTLITMFGRDIVLSLVLLASVPVMCIFVPLFERAVLKRWREARNAYSYFVGWLAEAINGAKTIKTLAIEGEVASEAKTVVEDIRGKRLRANRLDALFGPFVTVISQSMVAIVAAVGVYLIGASESEAETIATVVMFIGFVGQIYNPIQRLSEIFSDFMANQAGAEKVAQLLDAKIDVVDSPEVVAKYGTVLEPKEEAYAPLAGDIVFDKVSFSYVEGTEVIHSLSLTVKEGTSLAIVGETGSGKTTLVNLLCRFYEPSGGKILIGGKDYLSYSLGYLRNSIGYVQQTPFVFAATYFENIAYGVPGASLEEVRKAARFVGIDDFIMAQEKGYDTFLVDGGSSLSEGQKQLISFARAILRNPRLLILDEATSSIDTMSEQSIQKALGKLLKGRTSITIAHRLSTIVDSDRILVMDKGKIVEDGNHRELIEKKGVYYRLYMNQFQDLNLSDQLEVYEKDIVKKGIKL